MQTHTYNNALHLYLPAGIVTSIFYQIIPPTHRSVPSLGWSFGDFSASVRFPTLCLFLAPFLPLLSRTLFGFSHLHLDGKERGGKWRRQRERMRVRNADGRLSESGRASERKMRRDCGRKDEWWGTWCVGVWGDGALNACSSGLILQDRTIKD